MFKLFPNVESLQKEQYFFLIVVVFVVVVFVMRTFFYRKYMEGEYNAKIHSNYTLRERERERERERGGGFLNNEALFFWQFIILFVSVLNYIIPRL